MLEKYQANHIWKDGKRYYLTPGGEHFPGVTTILGSTKSAQTEKALTAWRARVGVEEAKEITRRAAERGTALHAAIEATLLNQPVIVEDIAKPYYLSMLPILPRVSNIQLIEGMLWHPAGFAGSVDCVAYYNGEISVIDWKTSDKPKRPNWIDDYFLQCSAYCAAVNRLYDTRIGRIVVVIAVPERAAQVFTVNGQELLDYWEMFNDRLKAYQKLFNLEVACAHSI
jgi:hypothetical protein